MYFQTKTNKNEKDVFYVLPFLCNNLQCNGSDHNGRQTYWYLSNRRR